MRETLLFRMTITKMRGDGGGVVGKVMRKQNKDGEVRDER